MAVINSPATASPRTYLPAPSMAAWNSASRVSRSRRRRDSSWSIVPACNSPSMAICLPGRASRKNRAFTSEMRLAPFVMTTNWMRIRIRKTTRRTTRLPPTTNLPKVATICPPSPFNRINRVVAMFSTRRKSVSSSSNEGNTATSSGSLALSVITSNRTVIPRLSASSMSSSGVGSGTNSTINTAKNATDSIRSLRRANARLESAVTGAVLMSRSYVRLRPISISQRPSRGLPRLTASPRRLGA